MTLLNPGKQVIKYCLGYCLPSVKENAAKIRIKRLKLDEYLLMVRHKLINIILVIN